MTAPAPTPPDSRPTRPASNDLSDFWVYCEIEKQDKLQRELRKGLDVLKNKTTPYAKGIARMIRVRQEIINMLEREAAAPEERKDP